MTRQRSKRGKPAWTPEARAAKKARRAAELSPKEPPVSKEFKQRVEAIIADRLKAVAEGRGLKTVGSVYGAIGREYLDKEEELGANKNWVNWRMRRVKQQLVEIHRSK